MEQNQQTPEIYDYRKYDRIWQRVAPTLEPYPGMGQTMGELAEDPVATVQDFRERLGTAHHEEGGESKKAAATEMKTNGMALTPIGQNLMPGEDPNPCCMGTAAEEMLEVMVGFIEEELGDRRHLLALSKEAPGWARQRLRDLADDEGLHARKLMAVYYLITGTCYRPAVCCERIYVGRWCPALRERYHAAACNGLNYVRAAESTTDPCLTKLLNELSREEYRHAECLLNLLQCSLGRA